MIFSATEKVAGCKGGRVNPLELERELELIPSFPFAPLRLGVKPLSADCADFQKS